MTTRQTTVHGYVAKNPNGTGAHTVLPHVRTVEVKADPSAPFMNRIKKLAEASNDRLNQGKFARAIALRAMAFDVMFAHRKWFGTDFNMDGDEHGPWPHPERRSPLGWQLEDEAFKLLSMNNPVHDVDELWRAKDRKTYIKGTAALSISRKLDMPDDEKLAKWAENIKRFEADPELVAVSTRWIDAYKKNHKIVTNLDHRCQRCGGTGKLDHFKHIDGGVCYECDGSGTDDHLHKADPTADLLAALGPATPLRIVGPYGEPVRLVMRKGAPFVGPRGGKWADAEHSIPWVDPSASPSKRVADLGDQLQERHGASKLYVSHNERTKTTTLSNLVIPKERRGTGAGEAILAGLTRHADEHGHRMELTAEPPPTEKGSKSRLTSWYKRHGFVENKGRHRDHSTTAGMYREPLAGMAKAVVSGQQTIDGYTCTSRRHDSGLTVVSIDGPSMTLPFHMVVPARDAMTKAREAVQLLKVGKVPMEGTFRRMEIPRVIE